MYLSVHHVQQDITDSNFIYVGNSISKLQIQVATYIF
jgi:hypothetical protein